MRGVCDLLRSLVIVVAAYVQLAKVYNNFWYVGAEMQVESDQVSLILTADFYLVHIVIGVSLSH